jgi:hypothetical protein
MASEPVSEQALQALIEELDAAGDSLREVLDVEDGEDSLSVQYYLDGSVFLEAGYVMIEQLAPEFPELFKAFMDGHYAPIFHQARRGQIGWNEAHGKLPEFMREYAAQRVHEALFMDPEDE